MRQTLHSIKNEVCAEHGVSHDELIGHRRFSHMVDARKDFAHRARKLGYSFPEIGYHLGGRDHSTIIHYFAKEGEDMNYEEAYAIAFCQLAAAEGHTPAPIEKVGHWTPADTEAISQQIISCIGSRELTTSQISLKLGDKPGKIRHHLKRMVEAKLLTKRKCDVSALLVFGVVQ